MYSAYTHYSSSIWDAVTLFLYMSVVDLNGYRNYTPHATNTFFSMVRGRKLRGQVFICKSGQY